MQNLGNLIDHMITEPEKVNYFKLTCAGEQLTEGDFKKAEEMKKAFMRDEFASRILPLSDTQKVMINPCQKFDYDIPFTLPVRCKWDLWMPSMGWGGDIKSTSATTQEQFESAVRQFDYDRQMILLHEHSRLRERRINRNFKRKLPRLQGIYQTGR